MANGSSDVGRAGPSGGLGRRLSFTCPADAIAAGFNAWNVLVCVVDEGHRLDVGWRQHLRARKSEPTKPL